MDVLLKSNDEVGMIEELLKLTEKDVPEGSITLRCSATLLKELVVTNRLLRFKAKIIRRIVMYDSDPDNPPSTKVTTFADLKEVMIKMSGKTEAALKDIHKEYVGY